MTEKWSQDTHPIDAQSSQEIIVATEAKGKKQKPPKISVLQLFRFATLPETFLILFAVFCSLAAGALFPIGVTIFGDMIQGIAVSDTTNIVDFVLPKVRNLLCLGAGISVVACLSNCLWILTGESQTRRIRTRYLHAILRQEMAWFDTAEEGSLNTRLAHDTQLIQDGISEAFGQSITAIAQFISGICVAFTHGKILSAVTIILLPIVVATGAAIGFFVKRYTTKYQNSCTNAATIAEQAFGNIRTVYSFSLESQFLQRYNDRLSMTRTAALKRGVCLGFGMGLITCAMNWCFGLGVWFGSLQVSQGSLTGGNVFVVLFSIMAGAMSMLKLPQLISAVSGATSAAYKIYSLIDRNPEIDWTSDIGIVPQKFTGDVKFQHISFHYPSRPQQPVLKNVDLEVHPGMTVALVGSSGSGKSTAVQLLQRFYDPTSGQILVGGHDLKTLNLSWVRQQIGIVSQEPVLFNMSIRENIILGTTHLVSSEELVDVCKKAHCHNFISQLPNGYDTLVGPQGGTLSGGQKQRIAIARAIIKNPAILLLDEATSALDTQSERLVQLALDSAAAGRTTLVVAHRLSTIRNANLIIVLDKGEIVEQGTHRTLVECNGIYAGMVKKQEIITSSDMSSSNESNTDEDTQVEQAPDTFDKVGSLAISEKDLSLKRQSTTDSANNHETAARKRLAGINEKEIESLPYRKIIQHMRPEWPLLVVGSLGSIISGSVLPMLALNLSTLVTLLVTPGSRPEDGPTSGANLHALLFVFLGIYALIGHTVQIICFDAAGERFAQRLRRLVFKAYMKQEVGYFDQPEHSSGSLTAALMVDTKNVKDLASKGWGDLIQIAVTVTMAMTIAFTHSWRLSLVILGFAPLVIAGTSYSSKNHAAAEDNAKKANAESGNAAGEAIREIRTVTSLHQQSYFIEKYAKLGEEPRRLCRQKAFVSSFFYSFLVSIPMYTQSVTFFASSHFIQNGWMKFTDLLPSLMVITMSSASIGRISNLLPDYGQARLSAISTFELLERQPTIDHDLEGIETCSIQGDIAFENIKFAYPSRLEQPVFDGQFSLRGTAGRTLAFVGHSGCGKSTIIALLQRWYDCQRGKVCLDGHNVKSYSVPNLRSHMALVGQEPVLFDMTIGENIRAGVVEAHSVSQDEIDQACKHANIYDFIMSLPDKYDTPVGDKGSQLSGGQKQRIAIARALIRKPKVLLLDEATSALDGDSEKIVQKALDNIIEQGGRTTITITHRLSTIQKADTIFVLKDGQVVEQGNHSELLQMNGVYSELVNQQLLNT